MNELAVSEYQKNVLAIEQSRAIQEVQAQMVIAKKFPRNEITARAKILKACERKSLAEVAEYVYPRGGTQITGPSIRLAEVLARYWQNLNYGLVEITQSDGNSDVIAFAWDLETNVKATRQFKVSHKRKAHGSFTELIDPRDIYEHVANQGQRRVRACILEIIPGDVIDEALEVCQKTLKSAHDEPLSDRIVKMIGVFDKLGVSQKMLEDRLGHPMDSTIEQELIILRKIYTSLNDGFGKREDFFSISQDSFGKAKSLDDLPPNGSGEDDLYKTNAAGESKETFQCPYCNHEPFKTKGRYDNHVEKIHAEKLKINEPGHSFSGSTNADQSTWADNGFWERNVSDFAELLGLPLFNRILARFDNAKDIFEVKPERREECWQTMSNELDLKNKG